MGFGIMFIGYFLLYLGAITPLSIYTTVVGSAIILYSLKELMVQNKAFLAGAVSAILLVIASIGVLFVDLLISDTSALYKVFLYSRDILSAVLNAFLMIAIYVIAKSVALPKIQSKAAINLLFIGIYAIGAVLFNTVFRNNEFAMSRLYVVVIICQFIYSVLGLVTVYSSYMRICYADDKDMSKKTGVGPMDFLNDKLNKAMTPKERRLDNNDRKGKK